MKAETRFQIWNPEIIEIRSSGRAHLYTSTTEAEEPTSRNTGFIRQRVGFRQSLPDKSGVPWWCQDAPPAEKSGFFGLALPRYQWAH